MTSVVRTSPVPITLAVMLAVLLVGCGIDDPYDRAPTTGSPTNERHVVDNEVRSGRHPQTAAPTDTAAASPRAAVERFARRYINWTYKTLASQRRQLARMAVGEAAATERRAAAETARDYELREGRVENRGQIVAVTRVRGHADRWVVVSRETTTGRGMYEGLPASYHVTLATVQRIGNGWAVSRWHPQS